ncbi:hypothetical protein B0A55_11059 [Friedmanniomyces simplex]|uniref:Uncharacterized protein n=1 Tax=Friedmanniomyces simplex TaxID=329884 RepID=A0A4U0WAZ3_9PEZI|nr:hypothetical protein B0A55_11059 [Friedmanniomyces simplex]
MRDTAQLNAFAVYGLEKFLSRQERAEIFRRMPGISSMLPIGGEAVWGDHTSAPDDRPDQNITYGNFISFQQPGNGSAESSTPSHNLTMDQALPFLFDHTQQWYRDATQQAYSRGVAHTRKVVEDNQHIPAKWINPLETRLPLAPAMKIFCFYGFGKPTERAYFYRDDPATSSSSGNNTAGGNGDPRVMIDTAFSTPNTFVDRGVVMGEGDGTVNLLSTGYMCNKGWKMKRYNPAGCAGGPNTGDHVDILGRSSLNDLILRIAGGQGDKIENKVYSDIMMYADRVRIYDDEAEEA